MDCDRKIIIKVAVEISVCETATSECTIRKAFPCAFKCMTAEMTPYGNSALYSGQHIIQLNI